MYLFDIWYCIVIVCLLYFVKKVKKIMYFLYGCGLFYENVTHLVRLWLYYVRKCHLWSWSWQKILLFVCFGLNYMNYCLILFFGVSESSINCYCLILLVFLFVYLYLFGLNRQQRPQNFVWSLLVTKKSTFAQVWGQVLDTWLWHGCS